MSLITKYSCINKANEKNEEAEEFLEAYKQPVEASTRHPL